MLKEKLIINENIATKNMTIDGAIGESIVIQRKQPI